MVYEPALDSGPYAIRTTGDPRTLARSVVRELHEVARDVPVWSLDTLDAMVDGTLVRERMVSSLCGAFGVFGLLLASIGLYGRLSYSVAERTGEIGLRMALGATQNSVRWMILRDALALILCGIAIGLPLALASASLVRSLLFGVAPSDPELSASGQSPISDPAGPRPSLRPPATSHAHQGPFATIERPHVQRFPRN
jgi:ABC-type antimicrobial peptide transport system permease subunit